jgi:hypothetical protein
MKYIHAKLLFFFRMQNGKVCVARNTAIDIRATDEQLKATILTHRILNDVVSTRKLILVKCRIRREHARKF